MKRTGTSKPRDQRRADKLLMIRSAATRAAAKGIKPTLPKLKCLEKPPGGEGSAGA